MATRIYLPQAGAPLLSPTVSATWENTTGFDRVAAAMGVASGFSTATVAKTCAASVGTGTEQCLARQYVLQRPLAAGNDFAAAVTVNLELIGIEVATTDDLFLYVAVRLWDSSGTLRLTMGPGVDGTELAITTPTSRSLIGTLGGVGIVSDAGDILGFEIGVEAQSPTTHNQASLYFGSGGSADIASGSNAETSLTLRPWIELGLDIQFQDTGNALLLGSD